jgi:hypothetical protein
MAVPFFIQIIDFIVLATAFSVAFISWSTVRYIYEKNELRKGALWFAIAMTFLLLRKIFDFMGEYIFISHNDLMNIGEDISFLIAIIAFWWGARKLFCFFKRINFRI